MAEKKATVTWSDVKSRLADFDRAGLLALVQDLYRASPENRLFLHTRFGLGEDVLAPYKATLDRWLWPDVFKNQDISVAKARKGISDYKKAVGRPEDLAELMVFYCERAAGFSADIGLEDEVFLDALVRMYGEALKTIATLPEAQRPPLWSRLEAVHRTSRFIGYGVSDNLAQWLAEYGVDG